MLFAPYSKPLAKPQLNIITTGTNRSVIKRESVAPYTYLIWQVVGISWQTIFLTYNFCYTITQTPINIHITKNAKSFNGKETFFSYLCPTTN
jgi:hypothetical protein